MCIIDISDSTKYYKCINKCHNILFYVNPIIYKIKLLIKLHE